MYRGLQWVGCDSAPVHCQSAHHELSNDTPQLVADAKLLQSMLQEASLHSLQAEWTVFHLRVKT
jgi:hypothetical protein